MALGFWKPVSSWLIVAVIVVSIGVSDEQGALEEGDLELRAKARRGAAGDLHQACPFHWVEFLRALQLE